MSLYCLTFGHTRPEQFNLCGANRLIHGPQDLTVVCNRCGSTFTQKAVVLYRDEFLQAFGDTLEAEPRVELSFLVAPAACEYRGLMYIFRDRPVERSAVVEFLREALSEKFAVAPDTIGLHTEICSDLGATSLDEVEVLMLVERHFRINLDDTETSACLPLTVKTIADLTEHALLAA